LNSGAFSPRKISEAAEEIRELLLDAAPEFVHPIWSAALERYCRVEGRAAMLNTYITAKVEDEGVEAVRPYLWTEATRADAQAQKAAQDLGLDPSGYARIARDMGIVHDLRRRFARQDLPPLGQQGREIMRQRRPELFNKIHPELADDE
jgi:hypothetical protein